jgi:hypothetical protein
MARRKRRDTVSVADSGLSDGELVPLADGPVASVLAGVDHVTGEAFALKVYPDKIDRSVRTELEAEFGKLIPLRAAAPVLVADRVMTHEGRCAVRMELAAQSLPDLIESFGPLSAVDALALGESLATALAAAHAVGVVHGGVTPGNVLFRPSGEAVLSDFGRALRSAFPNNSAEVGFRAPETVRDGTTSELTDIYGIGAILYLALAGRPPYVLQLGEHAGAHMLRVLDSPPPPLNRHDLPSTFPRLLGELLAKNPGDRPTDLTDIAAQLRQMRELCPEQGAPPGTATATAVKKPRAKAPAFDDFAQDLQPRVPAWMPMDWEEPVPVVGPAAVPPRAPAPTGPAHPQADGRPAVAAPGLPPGGAQRAEAAPAAPAPTPAAQPGSTPTPAAQHASTATLGGRPAIQAAPAPRPEAQRTAQGAPAPKPEPTPATQAAPAPTPEAQPSAAPVSLTRVTGEGDSGPVASPQAEPQPTVARPEPTAGVAEPTGTSEVEAPSASSSGASATHQTESSTTHQTETESPSADKPESPSARQPEASDAPKASSADQPQPPAQQPGPPQADPDRTQSIPRSDISDATVVVSRSTVQAADRRQFAPPAPTGQPVLVFRTPEARRPVSPVAGVLSAVAAVLVLAIVAVVALVAESPEDTVRAASLHSSRTPPLSETASPSAPPSSSERPQAVKLTLEAPIDRGKYVQMRWHSTTPLRYAVVVAGEGEETNVVIAGENTSVRVNVHPKRAYCFAVQGTDGDRVYESKPRGIRGATCSR